MLLDKVGGPLAEGFEWRVAIAGMTAAEARRPLARTIAGEFASQCMSEFLTNGGDQWAVLESIEPAWMHYFDFTIFECKVRSDATSGRRRLVLAVILASPSPLRWSRARRRPYWSYVSGEVPPVL